MSTHQDDPLTNTPLLAERSAASWAPKQAKSGVGSTVLFAVAVLLAAVLTRISHLNAEPFYDELYHILAAQSWLQDGTFTIYQGEYARTPYYTILTAWMFDLAGGPDLVMARAPNVLFGAMLAAASAVWTRQVAGPFAGWVVAIFVLLWPSGIHLSQIVRFYAIHGLLFFIAAAATFDLFAPHRSIPRRAVMAALAIVALVSAKHFQDSTLVGALGLATWAAVFVVLPGVLKLRYGRTILSATGALVVIAIIGFVATGKLAAMWAAYSDSPWGLDPTAYHRVLVAQYPMFWSPTPVLAILALRAFPRPAGFCATLVVVGLVLHSFAGVQNIRYIYYLTPFLFALWAMGVQALLPLGSQFRKAAQDVVVPIAGAGVVRMILVSALVFAVFTNDAATRSVKLITGRITPPFNPAENWSAARDTVAQAVDRGALIVATNELAAIHYYGGFDVVFSKNWLPEMNQMEFARDPRTGRPLISLTESFADLVLAYPSGLFLASDIWWSQWPVNNSVGELLSIFNVPGVSWSMDKHGPIWVLQWATETPADGDTYQSIRARVEKGLVADRGEILR